MTQPTAAPASLRVALVTDNYGPMRSGVLYAVQFLEGELLAHGHDVTVIAPQAHGPNPYKSHPRRREVRLPSMRVPGIGARVATGQQFEARLEQLLKQRFDVVHVQGLGPAGLLGMWLARRSGAPLLVTWHTDFEAYADHYWHLTPLLDVYYRLLKLRNKGSRVAGRSDSRRSVFRTVPKSSKQNLLLAAKQMLEEADLVTTPSDKTAQRVADLAPRSRVVVVPNGADRLPGSPPAPEVPPASGPRVLYVGRIAPEKGVGLLLDAFELVERQVPDAELMVVGDWRSSSTHLRERLRLAARRSNVRLVGEVDRDKLGPYYESADLFCFPSLTDTQALVLHEAAHAGLPIVSVDPELCLVCESPGNTRFARPNAVSLYNAIMAMLADCGDPVLREEMGACSKELASRYTIARQSERFLAIYQELAARERRPVERRRARGSRLRGWRAAWTWV
ncbi:glycosyltransferase [Propionicicella superfundia]|uniref:glycosyltransferase n=1 Tax=Propionicicella superfundia TaxID=348582 RepID=UPI00041B7845|nr:glycosyltransferase [Propionicicella superfundia]